MNVSASLYGYSTGRWEGRTLHVHTDHMNWGWFDQAGIPLNDDATVDEEFKLSKDGSRLDYVLTVTDPVNLAEPVIRDKYWVYVAEEEILPFDCLVKS